MFFTGNVSNGIYIQKEAVLLIIGKSSSEHSRRWDVPQSMAIMHNANDSLRCCNMKLCVSVEFQVRVTGLKVP